MFERPKDSAHHPTKNTSTLLHQKSSFKYKLSTIKKTCQGCPQSHYSGVDDFMKSISTWLVYEFWWGNLFGRSNTLNLSEYPFQKHKLHYHYDKSVLLQNVHNGFSSQPFLEIPQMSLQNVAIAHETNDVPRLSVY